MILLLHPSEFPSEANGRLRKCGVEFGNLTRNFVREPGCRHVEVCLEGLGVQEKRLCLCDYRLVVPVETGIGRNVSVEKLWLRDQGLDCEQAAKRVAGDEPVGARAISLIHVWNQFACEE